MQYRVSIRLTNWNKESRQRLIACCIEPSRADARLEQKEKDGVFTVTYIAVATPSGYKCSYKHGRNGAMINEVTVLQRRYNK